jgi:hypothetical protein
VKGFCTCFEKQEQQTFLLRKRAHATQQDFLGGTDVIWVEVKVGKSHALPVCRQKQRSAVRGTAHTVL